jgi:primosomal protein N' (replication factor Y) (superfamily II helicase)
VLRVLFKDKSIMRLDRDSTKQKGSLEEALEQINQGKVDIILGTQLLAKGHHFPNVTLVAILYVDSGLFSVDFHATEKLAQLIVQVSGRAGRADKPGKVIMQTRQPDHPLLTTLIRQGYQRFAENALLERQTAELPPFTYQALFSAEARDEDLAQTFLQAIINIAAQSPQQNVQILGHIPAPMTKRAGFYRYQLLLQSTHRSDLHILLDKLIPEIVKLKIATKVRWSLDVDPADLY